MFMISWFSLIRIDDDGYGTLLYENRAPSGAEASVAL